jgi:hypothetical protein
MLTVYILASSQEAKYVEQFWIHMALLRRQVKSVTWASPLYVENMATDSNALVATIPGKYIVVGCMSNRFVSALLDEPALREMIDGAAVKIPFVISPCTWNEAPNPFADRMPFLSTAITSAQEKDSLFAQAVSRLRVVVNREL